MPRENEQDGFDAPGDNEAGRGDDTSRDETPDEPGARENTDRDETADSEGTGEDASRKESGARENDEAGAQEAGEETGASRIDPGFFLEVMRGLENTNFARGWGSTEMYHDFLHWCETSEEADAIIASYFPEMPTLVVDPEEGVRLISLRANVATELMKALLDAFEERRIRDFLER